MLFQGSRYSVSQLSEETEATLSGFDALLLQLSVEGLYSRRHLDTQIAAQFISAIHIYETLSRTGRLQHLRYGHVCLKAEKLKQVFQTESEGSI